MAKVRNSDGVIFVVVSLATSKMWLGGGFGVVLSQMHSRWKSTGLLASVERWKPVSVEPRGSGAGSSGAETGGAESLDRCLARFLAAVRAGEAWSPPPDSTADGSESSCGGNNSGSAAAAAAREPTQNGAVLLAVCRGKVSEGIDFADGTCSSKRFISPIFIIVTPHLLVYTCI